jgi:hypothetical protein
MKSLIEKLRSVDSKNSYIKEYENLIESDIKKKKIDTIVDELRFAYLEKNFILMKSLIDKLNNIDSNSPYIQQYNNLYEFTMYQLVNNENTFSFI